MTKNQKILLALILAAVVALGVIYRQTQQSNNVDTVNIVVNEGDEVINDNDDEDDDVDVVVIQTWDVNETWAAVGDLPGEPEGQDDAMPMEVYVDEEFDFSLEHAATYDLNARDMFDANWALEWKEIIITEWTNDIIGISFRRSSDETTASIVESTKKFLTDNGVKVTQKSITVGGQQATLLLLTERPDGADGVIPVQEGEWATVIIVYNNVTYVFISPTAENYDAFLRVLATFKRVN